MANTLINLIITARNQAFGAFGSVINSLGSLGRNASAASVSTGSLTGSIVSGIVQANLLGQALNTVGNAAQFMKGKFEEAKKIQLDTVSAAGTFAALTGESYKESEKFVTSFGNELAKIAGAMPGATADYQKVANSIMDNVIPAFKDANGVLNKGEFQKNLTDITKKMTLLGISSGTDAGAVGMFTARLLDGNTSAANLAFADNNPAFMGLLEKELKKRGKTLKQMKDMAAKERLDVLQAVSGQLVTEDVITAASNTVDGLIASIQSTLFDPTSGIFGLLRDLNTGEGQQNVMTAIAGGIKAVTAFFESGAKLLSALGVPSVDPMLVLYNGINIFTSWIKKSADIINNITNITKRSGGGLDGFAVALIVLQKKLKPEILFKNILDMGTKGAKMLAPLAEKFLNPEMLIFNFQRLLDGLAGWLNKTFATLATSSAQLLSKGGGAAGFAAIGAIVGVKIGWFIGEVIKKITNFLLNLPWGNILITIGNLAIGAIAFIMGAVGGLAVSIRSASQEVNKMFWSRVSSCVKTLWDTLLFSIDEALEAFMPASTQINTSMGSFWSGWGEVFNFWISSATEKTNSGINYFWSGWGEVINFWITSATNSFNEACSAASNWIVNFATQVVEGANNFFSWVLQGISDGWNSMMQAINNAINGMVQQVQQIASNPIGAASSAVSNIGSSAVSSVTQSVGNAASGVANFLGFNSGNQPSTQNTQSTLNSNTAQRLQNANTTRNNSTSSNNYAPTIHVHGVTDPQKLAQAALDHLDSVFSRQQAATLAP